MSLFFIRLFFILHVYKTRTFLASVYWAFGYNCIFVRQEKLGLILSSRLAHSGFDLLVLPVGIGLVCAFDLPFYASV
jgi:hypothetical protein